eukprot:3780753-Pleurochrysis_carterae.AAC.1
MSLLNCAWGPGIENLRASSARCRSCKKLFDGEHGPSQHIARTPSCRSAMYLRLQQKSENVSEGRSKMVTNLQQRSRAGLYEATMKAIVLDGLSSLRLDALMPDTIMARVKTTVASRMKAAAGELHRRLTPYFLNVAPCSLRTAVDRVLNVFRKLETSALEQQALMSTAPST